MRAVAAVLALAAAPGIVLAQGNSGELVTLKVQGNVYVISGAGGNIAVQTGDQGVLVVDTGLAAMSDKVVAAIRKLSDKPIQYIINTHVHPDHTGGNVAVRKAGLTYVGANVTGNLTDAGVGAQIWAQDNVLKRMSAPTGQQAPTPFDAWPTETYLTGRKQLFFNGEPIEIVYQPAAHTDGDSLVIFRRSDVVVAGDIFVTTTYPFIDVDRGGSIQGEVDALNNIMDIAIPGLQDEGGTYIIPGHGHICDQPDLLEYRDMVTIIRDRIQAAIKKGMTLEQVKAAGLTKDYDGRYGAKTGFGTADMFVEAIYKTLTRKK
ncbi:MAG TPA: MBL fold metallo-hydrolase [Bryobacteraceae bacterium]|nr:MBL fold metallo-hydrolase [Bryobacteraceae bacterium]